MSGEWIDDAVGTAAELAVPGAGPFIGGPIGHLMRNVRAEWGRLQSQALRVAERSTGFSREEIADRISADPRLIPLAAPERIAACACSGLGQMAGTTIERMAPTAASPGNRVTWLVRVGGLAALVGGLAWAVKGVVILVGGEQPPMLFEVSPALFGLGLPAVAIVTLPLSRRRTAVVGLAVVAVITGLPELASDLVGRLAGVGVALSSVAWLVGLLSLARIRRAPAPLAWWLGVSIVPCLVVMGLLAAIDERLIEIPLVCIGLVWALVGWVTLHQQPASETAG